MKEVFLGGTCNGQEEYIKALEHARQKNIELGYLTEAQLWNRERYEEQTRTLIVTGKQIGRAHV